MRIKNRNRHNVVAAAVVMAAASFGVSVGVQAYAQQVKKKVREEESFTRPKPTRPIKPEVPGVNRYQDDKVFLEYADSLYKTATSDTVEKQIVRGNVKFRQGGMWMYCDMAYYYPELNSLDAFGNVKMEQGDTLFVYADQLYYEGNARMARLKNGYTRPKVQLINRDVTLTTDSLDYDLAAELGWYSYWGTIDDKVNTLTSLYGEYSPGTKNADFYHDVKLVNNEDGFVMLTDTLHYNTESHIARIESKTEIHGANDTIITTRGLYNTQAGDAELLSRSMIIHRDSNNNVTTLEGDSIIYDKLTRISRAYMFRDPLKHGMPMVLTDTAHKTTLIGGFGIYNDSTRESLATEYPLLMEYSQTDTIFLRADTIKTYIVSAMVPAGRKWTLSGYPEKNGIPIIKADSTHLWIDELLYSLVAPLLDVPLKMLNAVAPQITEVISESESAVNGPVDTDTYYSGEPNLGTIDIVETDVREEILRNGSMTVSGMDPLDRDTLHAGTDSVVGEILSDNSRDVRPGVPDAGEEVAVMSRLDSVVAGLVDSIPEYKKDFHVALAYHRARFFKQDIQGVADSMVFVEQDSMLYMFRKPIVWSGERQVTGNRIDVHFNDSTADWALLPESGMMSEHIDEDFYNQLAGKTLRATFANQTLKKLDVSGNVETIFLPQESDSTFNRLINAESSFLTIELDSGKMDKLKMWPEVSGSVTPIFLVKNSQKYLLKFHWWESLRPVREWYGNRVRWADNLGEVPDELEQYFLAPSDFGEPKTFSASRFIAPAPSIPPVDSFGGGDGIESGPDPLSQEEENLTLPEIEAEEDKMEKLNESVTEESEEIEKDDASDFPGEDLPELVSGKEDGQTDDGEHEVSVKEIAEKRNNPSDVTKKKEVVE